MSDVACPFCKRLLPEKVATEAERATAAAVATLGTCTAKRYAQWVGIPTESGRVRLMRAERAGLLRRVAKGLYEVKP